MITYLRPLLLALAFLIPVAANAVDEVIFRDGFRLRGRLFKEQETIRDPGTGTAVIVPKMHGFDIVESGAKLYVFSNKAQQVSKVLDNIKDDIELREYMKDVLIKSKSSLPAGILQYPLPEFDKNWRRTLKLNMPQTKGFAHLEQKIKVIGPSRIVIPCVNYAWYPYYDPREFDPAMIRKLLAVHENLEEKAGTPDISKRLDIARYFLDAGFLEFALKELDDTRAAVPGAWPKELVERADTIAAEIRKQRMQRLVENLDIALRAGQYRHASTLAPQFDDKNADPSTVKQFTMLKARMEDIEPRFNKAKTYLRDAIDQLSGRRPLDGALPGAAALATQKQSELAIAGEAVLTELHPDTIERIDGFLTLAAQAERKAAAGQPPGVSPEQLVAMAVTGWLKGKNGAEQDAAVAQRLWAWRSMLLNYQDEPILNNRRRLYQELSSTGALSPDEIAQLISYLPPPRPEDLANPRGTQVSPGVYLRNTGAITETANGVNYLVRLPREYHHGRPTRVIVALTTHSAPPERIIDLLTPEADRHGYIILAPLWIGPLDNAYDFKGDRHYLVRAVLRDALRSLRVDNDRVFLYGMGDGANFALDVGSSHPDLFAGIVAIGPNPRLESFTNRGKEPDTTPGRTGLARDPKIIINPRTFMPESDLRYNTLAYYWKNCQKLPVFCCLGTLDADGMQAFRRLYENWMERAYPAMGMIFRGRGFHEVSDWLRPELPVIFEWMNPKKRITGTGMLRVNETIEPWITARESDNRFYWVGTDKIDRGCKLETWNGQSFMPAEITADIRSGNQIVLKTRGVNNVILWFDRTLIDWLKPISVTINGTVPNGYKPKVLQPDIEFMLEQLYSQGDRSLLFLNRLEFPTVR